MTRRRLLAGITTATLGLVTLTFVQAAPVAAAFPSQCAFDDDAPIVTCTFTGAPGSTFSLQLPDGVTSAHLHVVGRFGEDGVPLPYGWYGATGGRPAVIDADVPTAPGSNVFSIRFRDNGGFAYAGGTGASPQRSGGGSSAVFLGGSSAETLVAEAGGGGGGGSGYSYNDIPPVQDGWATPFSAGGDAGAAGDDAGTMGSTAVTPAGGGQPGTVTAGGAGGHVGVVDTASSHPLTLVSGSPGSSTRGGAGGGGEFYGGGGGGGTFGGGGGGGGGTGQESRSFGAGGGGGSSTVPPGGSLGLSSHENALVRITYALDGKTEYSTSSLDFGAVPVGTTSAARAVTVTNVGPGPIAVGGGGISGPGVASFDFVPGGCGPTTVLGAGSACQVAITFHPSAAGSVSATLTIGDSSGARHDVSLTGFGGQPIASPSPSAVAFGSVDVGAPPSTRTITLSNSGNVGLVVASATVSGDPDFSVGPSGCSGTTVAPGSSCSVTVRFDPTSVGNRTAALRINHNAAGGSTVIPLSGAGTPPADLKILGVGSVYTGRDHLVTRVVAGTGTLQTYPLVVLNEDSVARSYTVQVVESGSSAKTEIWSTGLGGKALMPYGAHSFTTGLIQPGKSVSYSLRVTPLATGQTTSRVEVFLQTDFGASIESLETETNTAAPANGTSSFELFAKQGTQLWIGGPVSGQTATGPALNVSQAAPYTVRLKNNGSTARQIGLRLTDVDGCAGSFAVTVTAAGKVRTVDAYAGTFLTPVLAPGGYQDIQVSIKRTATGCPARTVRAESLDGGVPVRTSYLRANAAYDAATD